MASPGTPLHHRPGRREDRGNRSWLYLFVLAGLGLLARALGQPQMPSRAGEWPLYGHDAWGTRSSPAAQIDAANLSRLRVAWIWDSVDNPVVRDHPDLKPGPYEGTPIMVDGVLYVSTGLNQVAALDARTGKARWVFNPDARGYVHRGVAYWESGSDRRILFTTKTSYLYALDAADGKPIRSFGRDGRVDLTLGLRRPVDRGVVSQTSPPIILGDVIVVGGAVDDFQDQKSMPPGDVRGFDVRTGRQLWVFHTIPQPGEFGNDTWKNESWKYTGSANVWTIMSADPELGYVYLPIGTPNNDWYGGHRPGDGLFGESLVCLDAKTGKRVWHFQMVHHGVWDYDLPAPPNLIDVVQDGRRIKAVAQVTKQAFCFVFDRVTGRPLWPIDERPVPPTTMPGDTASPTQPFPTKPAAFDRQGLTTDDLIDFTPQLRKEAEEILATWVHGPLYTPPSTKRTVLMPGWVGGASWAGAAADPETGMLYVPSISNPMWLELKRPEGRSATVTYMIGESGDHVDGPQGLPLVKPPYGRITAIDLKTGDHAWMSPLGDLPRDLPALKGLDLPPLGLYRRGFVIVTKPVLLALQEGAWFNREIPRHTPKLRAFDKRTGRLLAEVEVPGHATGAPITYEVDGRQFIVFPVGGAVQPARLIALSLP